MGEFFIGSGPSFCPLYYNGWLVLVFLLYWVGIFELDLTSDIYIYIYIYIYLFYIFITVPSTAFSFVALHITCIIYIYVIYPKKTIS